MRHESGEGPLGQATARLLERLGVAEVPVVVGHPAGAGDPARLVVWPVTVVPEALPAQGTPLRMRVRFLLCASDAASPALELLDRILLTDQPYLVPDEVPESLWNAIGARHRIGLLFDVPVQVARPVAVAPRVTALPSVVGVSVREVAGKVVTITGVPLAGMRVAVADGTSATHTDTRGRFTLPGVVVDQPLRLLVTGRGLRLSAEVGAVTAEPVVITCEI